MNTRLLVVALAAVWLSCAPNASSLQLGNIYFAASSGAYCGPTDVGQVHGSLDISASGSFLATVSLDNLLAQESTVQSGTTVNVTANDIDVTSLLLSYSADKPINLETETVNLYFSIKPGSTNNKAVGRLIGPKAAEGLAARVSPGDVLQLKVKIQATGVTRAGVRLTSNAIEFPITVYSSGFAGCAPPDKEVKDGPCNNLGQDSVARCCSQDPNHTSCKT